MGARNPIRVLHVGKFYFPVEGGIENVVQEIVAGFAGDPEVRADVLVSQQKGAGKVDQLHGAAVHRVRSHGVLLGTPLCPGLPAAIERLAPQYDIVHVHTPNPLPFFCNWRKLKRAGVRLVVHHHSDIVRPVQQKLLRTMRRPERRFFAAADRVVSVSDRLLRHSAMLQPVLDRCSVLPLSIDLRTVRQPTAAERITERERLGYREGEVVFFFLGRLVWYKGVDLLLRAAATMSCHLLIGGDGPMRAEWMALAAELGLEDRVRFLGRVDQAERHRYYSAADAFVLPSSAASETFGVVQLEAMAHGLPVINTLLPTGVPEVSLHGETGLTVLPGDVASLRRALETLASSPGLRTQFAAAALRRVRLFDRPAMLAGLRELYREVQAQPIQQLAGGFDFKPQRNVPRFDASFVPPGRRFS